MRDSDTIGCKFNLEKVVGKIISKLVIPVPVAISLARLNGLDPAREIHLLAPSFR